MTYQTIVVVPASTEPVDVLEAKAQLRIESSFTLDDTYIESLISTARDRAEKFCNRFFTEQTVTILFDDPIPVSEIKLPYSNLVSVDSVQAVVDNTLITIDPSQYYADTLRQRITNVGSWPSADNYRVTVTTQAPAELSGVKQAMLMMVSDMYGFRDESVIGTSVVSNPAVKALLYPYREGLSI
jgi:uncharacterized phiE125 gp8 family phage protein